MIPNLANARASETNWLQPCSSWTLLVATLGIMCVSMTIGSCYNSHLASQIDVFPLASPQGATIPGQLSCTHPCFLRFSWIMPDVSMKFQLKWRILSYVLPYVRRGEMWLKCWILPSAIHSAGRWEWTISVQLRSNYNSQLSLCSEWQVLYKSWSYIVGKTYNLLMKTNSSCRSWH